MFGWEKLSRNHHFKSLYFHLALVLFVFIPCATESTKIPERKNLQSMKVKMVSGKKYNNMFVSHSAYVEEKKVASVGLDDFLKTIDFKEPAIPSIKMPRPLKQSQSSVPRSKKITTLLDDIIKDIPQDKPRKPIAKQMQQKQKIKDILQSIMEESKSSTSDVVKSQVPVDISVKQLSVVASAANVEPQKVKMLDGYFYTSEVVEKIDSNSLSSVDLIDVQMQYCWNQFSDPRLIHPDLYVLTTLFLDKSGNVTNIEIEPMNYADKKLHNAYKETVRSVVAAVRLCSPFKGLPVGDYGNWREVNFRFKHTKD